MEAQAIQEQVTNVKEPYHKNIALSQLLDLRKKNLTVQQIADLLGCSKANVVQRLAPYRDELEQLNSFKNNRADIFTIHQARLLNSVTVEDIKAMPVASRITAAAILYDKERLERNQTTENVGIEAMVTHRQTLEEASKEAQERKEEALAQIAQLQSGKASPAGGNDRE